MYIVNRFNVNSAKRVSTLFENSNALSYSNTNNLTLDFLEIDSKTSPCVTFSNCDNIAIRFLKIKNVPMSGATNYAGKNVALNFSSCDNVTIDYVYFESICGGIYAVNCNSFTIGQIWGQKIRRDVNWGTGLSSGRGQLIQFNQVGGTNVIEDVFIQNPFGYNNEDMINMYRTTADGSVVIRRLKIRGAGGNMPSSNGGVLFGDGNSDGFASDNCTLEDAEIISPGQYGVGIFGGTGHTVQNCKIYSPSLEYTNVGLYAFKGGSSTTLADCTVINNQINWRTGPLYTPLPTNTLNNTFLPTTGASACINPTFSNNVNTPSLGNDMLPEILVSETLFDNMCYEFIR
jgi:hypothetical protein